MRAHRISPILCMWGVNGYRRLNSGELLPGDKDPEAENTLPQVGEEWRQLPESAKMRATVLRRASRHIFLTTKVLKGLSVHTAFLYLCTSVTWGKIKTGVRLLCVRLGV